MNSKHQLIEKSGQALFVLFIVVMILRINTYFMVSENPTITRIFKTGLRVALTGTSFLMLRSITRNGVNTRFEWKNILAFLIYILYLFVGFASLLWSSDPGWSGLQIAMDVECVFFVLYYWKALIAFNEQKHLRKKIPFDYILWVSIAWVTISFLIGAIAVPDTFFRGTHGGEVQRLGGWVINPNELGMLCVIGAGGMYVNIMRDGLSFWKGLSWILILLALVLTQSRSSLISFFLTTLYFVFISGKAKLIVPTIVIGAVAAPIVFMTIFVKDGDVGEVMSMTGRLPFWDDLLTYGFTDRPLYGFGFMRIHYNTNFPSIHAFPGAMTHNTFMQLLLNLGMIGAVVCGSQMLFTFRGFMRESDPFLRNIFMGMIFGILINSFTEFGIFGDANYGIMFWLFLVMMFVLKAHQRPFFQQKQGIYEASFARQ
ncbi:MAG: O-antigen ligase family protein [Bacteroidota bacterium]